MPRPDNGKKGNSHMTTPINPLAEKPDDLIPTGRSKPKSRSYEKSHKGYTYYLKDAEIGKHISDIAYHYDTTVDSIAIEFIQIALEHADQIPWEQFPTRGNARSSASSWTVQADGWAPGQIRERPRGKKSTSTPEERKHSRAEANSRLVCYRWSADIHNALVKLEHERFGVPTGRKDGHLGLVVTTLFTFTLSLFDQGKLRYTPPPE
jgi:hypothetical protein